MYTITLTPAVAVIIGVFLLALSALQIYSGILNERLERLQREEKRLLSDLVKALRESAQLQWENLSVADQAFLYKQQEDAARWRTIRYYGPDHPFWLEWGKAEDEFNRDALVDIYRND